MSSRVLLRSHDVELMIGVGADVILSALPLDLSRDPRGTTTIRSSGTSSRTRGVHRLRVLATGVCET